MGRYGEIAAENRRPCVYLVDSLRVRGRPVSLTLTLALTRLPCILLVDSFSPHISRYLPISHRLPCIYLVDSGGANLPRQAEVRVRVRVP